jgi:putative glutamine amidotransferase
MSGYRPLIAVVAYHLGGDRVARWPAGGYGVPGPYVERLRAAGARTAILAPGEDGEPAELLEPFDGLLLVGGGDVDPARYRGDPNEPHTYGVEPDRDAFEIALLLEADRARIPTLCVCRGMQVMNVAFGGTLHQHLPDVDGLLEHGVPIEDTESVHSVNPKPASRLSALTKSGPLSCASHHHQGIDRLGDGLEPTGRSSDGLVEAIERTTSSLEWGDTSEGWMLGVQWHPEETAHHDPAQQSLFDSLALLARVRGARGHDGAAGRGRDYRVADPDPAWEGTFEVEAARIRAALPSDLLVQIDHVGSTAVPGLAAKPIIDISVALASMIPRTTYVEPLRKLGYRWVADPWDDTHEYFSLDVDGGRAFHAHACLAGGEFQRRHIAFRDWLRAHPDDAEAYGALKRELATRHPRDAAGYTEGKSAFIGAIEAKALAGAR